MQFVACKKGDRQRPAALSEFLRTYPQHGRPRPQHARASQQDAANFPSVFGEAAKAAELDISRSAAVMSFVFIQLSP